LRSPDRVTSLKLTGLLFARELRELFVGRPLWAMLVVVSLLVGFSFIASTDLYNQASKGAEQLRDLATGLVPLDGIVLPTFGAVYLMNTFLLPFVAIRSIGNEKQSGSLKLLLQLPLGPARIVAIKLAALGLGWLLGLVPGLAALAIWLAWGGHLYAPETLNLLLGHALYALVVAGVAFFAAALTESVPTAALLALAVTLGIWVIDFVGSTQSGWIRDVAAFSPTVALRGFEHGVFASSQALILLEVAAALLALAAIWLPSGLSRRRKVGLGGLVVGAAAVLILLSSRASFSADMSEDRRNSFNPADERALRQLDQELKITVNVAPGESRARDLERNVLSKLRRVVPHLSIAYADILRAGRLGTAGNENFGVVTYEYGGQRAESRATPANEILPIIYGLTGQAVKPDPETYPGYPLFPTNVRATVIPVHDILLPLLCLLGWWLNQRPPRVERIFAARSSPAPLTAAEPRSATAGPILSQSSPTGESALIDDNR